jgi:hypothetical protein
MSDNSSHPKIELNAFDVDMLLAIIKLFGSRSPSSYSIWSYMKDEAIRTGDRDKFMAYKNVNKRIIKLLNHGLISRIKTDKTNVRDRKDYKLNDVGLTYLVPYFLTHPTDIKVLVYYMNYYEMDKINFGRLLRKEYTLAAKALNAYEKYSKSLDPDETFIEVDEEVAQRLKARKRKGESYKRLLERLLDQWLSKTANEDLSRKRKERSRIAGSSS